MPPLRGEVRAPAGEEGWHAADRSRDVLVVDAAAAWSLASEFAHRAGTHRARDKCASGWHRRSRNAAWKVAREPALRYRCPNRISTMALLHERVCRLRLAVSNSTAAATHSHRRYHTVLEAGNQRL